MGKTEVLRQKADIAWLASYFFVEYKPQYHRYAIDKSTFYAIFDDKTDLTSIKHPDDFSVTVVKLTETQASFFGIS